MRRLAPFLAVLLCLVVTVPASAALPRQEYIIGGTVAAAGSYPWQVALISGDDSRAPGSQFCGGTLIAPDKVLTAAHCVMDELNLVAAFDSIDVFAGQTDLREPGQRSNVTAISVHPAADVSGVPRNDAALLTLQTPITAAEIVDVVDAEGGSEDGLWAPGEPLVVAGWGNISRTVDPEYPNELHEVELARITDAACLEAWRDDLTLTSPFSADDMVCAGVAEGGDPDTPGAGRDSCNGDSGGGLLARTGVERLRSSAAPWRVMGIVSWGATPCDAPSVPGVYTRVGAPAIRDYVTTTTPAAPSAAGLPALTGTADVGQRLTCASPGWDVTPDRELLEIYRTKTGTLPSRVAKGPSYTVTEADRTSSFICLASARTAGGQRAVESAVRGPVPAVVEPEPTNPVVADPVEEQRPDAEVVERPAPPAEPAAAPPTPAAVQPDVVAPRTTIVGRRACRRTRRCTLSVLVSDLAPSAGIRSVRATVTYKVRRRCRTGSRRRMCSRTVRRKVTARRRGARVFMLSTPVLPRGRHTVRVTATDLAGNAQRLPTTVRLRVR